MSSRKIKRITRLNKSSSSAVYPALKNYDLNPNQIGDSYKKPKGLKKANLNSKIDEPFKGYNTLVENNFEYSAKQITEILNTDTKEMAIEVILSKNSIRDFVSYCESFNYFENQATLTVNDGGFLSADWHLSKSYGINIVFYGNEKISLMVLSKDVEAVKNIKLRSILSILKKLKVPTV